MIVEKVSQLIAWIAAGVLVLFIINAAFAPLGRVNVFRAGDTKNISTLAPDIRVNHLSGNITEQLVGLIYFQTKLLFGTDNASVSLKLRSTNPTQQVSIGYRDLRTWHYATKIVYAPLMNSIGMKKLGDGPYLYQREPTFKSVRQFLTNIPTDKFIGVFDYDTEALIQNIKAIPGYKPKNESTVIDTPLRGKATIYAYLSDEPFNMTIQKRDLNWYGDPDVLTAKVYKGKDQVFEVTIGDDGNTSSNRVVGSNQVVDIKNPSGSAAEAGVYKIVIDAPSDVVTTRITTNLHKLVFEGPVYPISNSQVYPGIVTQTTPTSIYTNALELTAITYHDQFQMINIEGANVALSKSQQITDLNNTKPTATIVLPKSDVTLNGIGYFAFNQDQFFEPTPYRLLHISDPTDLTKVDFVLTNYKEPIQLGDGWVEVTQDFDLENAVVQKGALSWVISVPGLGEATAPLQIKDIQITLSKKGWFK